MSPQIIIILLTFQFNPDESGEADVDGADADVGGADADMPEIETPNKTSKTKDR